MRRTAGHILSSPNPAQLEMRILANHGGDKRFAFLKGRWKGAWEGEKRRVRMETARNEQEGKEKTAALGELAGYGDSDDDEADEKQEGGTQETTTGDEEVMEARRRRAKEWAEKRRALKASIGDET